MPENLDKCNDIVGSLVDGDGLLLSVYHLSIPSDTIVLGGGACTSGHGHREGDAM